MNFIMLTLVVALCLWGYVHLSTWFPGRIRDSADTILFLLSIPLSFIIAARLRHHEYHYSVMQILAAAFLAEVFVAVRGLLVVLFDMCKVGALTKGQRRSR